MACDPPVACQKWEERKEIYQSHGGISQMKEAHGLEKQAKYQTKLCLICGMPKKVTTELCAKCRKRKHELDDMYPRKDIYHGKKRVKVPMISNRDLLIIHKNHPGQDVFDYLTAHPDAIYEAFFKSKKERADIKSQEKIKSKELSNIYIDFENTELKDIPQYLINLQKELPTLSFHTADGNIKNPMIAFTCKRCGKDYSCRMEDIIYHSHSCPASTSSGETIVKEFLKEQGIPYLTQRDTLKCINPDTHYVLPYDFQLVNKKVIIEVQGEQHYRFVPVFHGTEEGFKYQQKKDAYKKKHALECGFKYLEIDYKQIEDGSYKQIIMSALI